MLGWIGSWLCELYLADIDLDCDWDGLLEVCFYNRVVVRSIGQLKCQVKAEVVVYVIWCVNYQSLKNLSCVFVRNEALLLSCHTLAYLDVDPSNVWTTQVVVLDQRLRVNLELFGWLVDKNKVGYVILKHADEIRVVEFA